MRQETIDKIHRFAEAWVDADSLHDAHDIAETGITDDRGKKRFRRKAEKFLGITLEPHNPEFSTDKEIECPSNLDLSAARKLKKFTITSHTNNSDLHEDFFTTLGLFSAHHEAQKIVIPVQYQNANVITRNEDYKWDARTYDYILKDVLRIGKNLVINGGCRIQATAVNPLSAMEELSAGRNAVYGHPQIAMQPIPTPNSEMARFMHTTGSCNKSRYSATKAGGKANFHHSIGALFVQVVGDFHYPMQLNWNGSGFHYMDEYWTVDGMVKADRALALNSGDIHADWECKKNTKKKNQLMDRLNVIAHITQDLHNQTRGSHHNSTRTKIEMAMRGEVLVEEEMYKSVDYIRRTARDENLIIDSNHNDHADQWLDRFKPWEDPHNAPFAALLQSQMYGTNMNALETYFSLCDTSDFTYEFVPASEPKLIGDRDVSQHGHRGANGARGSTVGFSKTVRKIVHGHTHTPRIVKGAASTGHSFDAKKASYAKDGYSTWAMCDVIHYADGKISHFFYGPNCNPPQLK